jgi:hypothetical protein
VSIDTRPDDTITAKVTACHFTVSGLPTNDAAEYDENEIPTEPAVAYYFQASLAGQEDLKSHVFTPSADGDHEWDGVIFPAAGTWTLEVLDVSDDSTADSTSVVVA